MTTATLGDRPAWGWLRYLGHLALRLLWYGDTIPIRVLMALASLLLAAIFAINPEGTFGRQTWVVMGNAAEVVIGRWAEPGYVWAALFALHGLGVFWRLAERTPRIYWALAINALGVWLWTLEVILTSIAIGGGLSAGNALPLVCTLALFVSLVRTGLNDEKLSP